MWYSDDQLSSICEINIESQKSLDVYFLTRRNEAGTTVSDYLLQDDWDIALEVEAILSISKDLVKTH